MGSKLLIGMIVVLLGLAIGWYALSGKQGFSLPSQTITATPSSTSKPEAIESQESNPGQPVSTTTVYYKDSGFAPATVTVKAGTAVKFINQSGRQMWVASNVHPTHQILPGFDELSAVANGGSYTYAFTKVGTWKYHNHINPTEMGTVIATN